ncbi:hypothetical protein [Actinotalea solisilvae]|uniref:hypothetical protein n=2 Tax=Actinotalea solisilvae TaxID=2072922 RepID=UPI0018F185F5|nr:hypothetical protein [Actinotalea solisilvae]
MTTNPLVAGPVDTSSALGGTMLVESLYDLSRAIESEDWVAAGLAGLSTVLDTAAAVMDPLGQLIAAGLGWLMEHVEPLKGWLDDLTGDAGAVLGFAGTWDNIATQMGSAAGDLDHLVAADLEGMRGQGVEAYARYASDVAEHLRGIGGSSTAVASSLRTCSTIVQVVHDLVRDAIAELVGAAISWAAQIVFTVGLGTPWVVSQVATRVSSLAARVGSKVTGVITSARALGDLIDALKAAIRSLGDNLRGARPGTTHTPRTPDVPMQHTGGSYRPRPASDIRAEEWADRTYDAFRADPDLAADIARNNPDLDPDDVERALRHVLEDEHLLGTDYGEPWRGRFDANPDMAEAFLRLRSGDATPTDRLLIRHEIAESAYMRSHPGASYAEAHAHANSVANWQAALDRRGGS